MYKENMGRVIYKRIRWIKRDNETIGERGYDMRE
jgi:hypothetical protein